MNEFSTPRECRLIIITLAHVQQFSYILFQLSEAKTLIQEGEPQQLRIALILLDNAVEFQLGRLTNSLLGAEEHRDHLRTLTLKSLETNKTPLPPSPNELIKWEPLSRPKKKSIRAHFDEKLWYLTNRTKELDADLSIILRHLHRYRNNVYHVVKVREETIDTVCRLLLEVNCELLTTFPNNVIYSSDEDYAWIAERFGFEDPDYMWSHNLDPIANELRRNMVANDKDVCALLGKHLRERLDEVKTALKFCAEMMGKAPDLADAMKLSQFSLGVDCGEIVIDDDPYEPGGQFENYNPTYSLGHLQSFATQGKKIEIMDSRFDAFRRFAELETQLEVIEAAAFELEGQFDRWLQLEIDIRRGK